MFKIKVGTLRDPVFHHAMRKLYTSDKLQGIKVAHHVKKMVMSCDEMTNTANDAYKNLIEEYCERDEAGTPVLANEKDPGSRKIREDAVETFNKKVVEMNEEEVDVDVKKIDVSLISKVQLAPAELTILDPVLEWKNFE